MLDDVSGRLGGVIVFGLAIPTCNVVSSRRCGGVLGCSSLSVVVLVVVMFFVSFRDSVRVCSADNTIYADGVLDFVLHDA